MKIEINYYHFESLNRSVLALGNQVRELSNENQRLKDQVRYWQIEADTDHGRWMRALEEIETLRKGV
jgi:dimeric dUTPase (all-alpha-NTP-PPase superfamily)